MTSSILLLAIFLVPGASPTPCKTYIASPRSVLSEVRTRGASSVLLDLYGTWESASFTASGETPPFDCWTPVLANISDGSKAWLEVAWVFRQHSDAGVSSMLDEAVDDALDTNPANVLRLVLARPACFPLPSICGSQIPTGAASEQAARAAFDRRHASLNKVTDPQLRGARDECLALLARAKDALPHLYRSP